MSRQTKETLTNYLQVQFTNIQRHTKYVHHQNLIRVPELETRPQMRSQAQKGYSTTASGKRKYQNK